MVGAEETAEASVIPAEAVVVAGAMVVAGASSGHPSRRSVHQYHLPAPEEQWVRASAASLDALYSARSCP